MDPQQTLAEINLSGCRQAIQDLLEWKRKGGFRPSGAIQDPDKDFDPADRDDIEELNAWLRGEPR